MASKHDLCDWPDDLESGAFDDIQCQTSWCKARRLKRIKGDKYRPGTSIYPDCGDKVDDYSGLVHQNRLDAARAKESADG